MTRRGDWPVWDVPVRLIHWYFPVAVGFMWWTGETGRMVWHQWCGYSVLVAVLTRVSWGFVGSHYARFSQFLRGPKAIWHYLRGTPHEGPGHNPLGGWSTLTLLLLLVIQGSTGMMSTDDISFEGPLAFWAGDLAGLMTAWHEVNWAVLRTLIIIHIGAIAVYQFWKRKPLLMAMWYGRAGDHMVEYPPRSGFLAVVLSLCFAGAILVLHRFAPQAPPLY